MQKLTAELCVCVCVWSNDAQSLRFVFHPCRKHICTHLCQRRVAGRKPWFSLLSDQSGKADRSRRRDEALWRGEITSPAWTVRWEENTHTLTHTQGRALVWSGLQLCWAIKLRLCRVWDGDMRSRMRQFEGREGGCDGGTMIDWGRRAGGKGEGNPPRPNINSAWKSYFSWKKNINCVLAYRVY